MAKIDPALRFLLSTTPAEVPELAIESAFGVRVETTGEPTVGLIAELDGSSVALEAAGFVVRARLGDIVTGDLPLSAIPLLEDIPAIRRVEVSRALALDLDVALPEAEVSPLHSGSPSRRGSGVIIGIIDSGIDYQHPSFKHPNGTTRILAIWDQRLNPAAGESHPAGFAYGVEYQAPAIDAALATATPLTTVRHRDSAGAGFHGTHVAGIAAGNGEPAPAGGPQFVGVAPEADLIVVANTRARANAERGLGDSVDTLDAVQYILKFADALGRPVVINQSQGDNVGPHDGTSLLEVGIASLIVGAGHVMVKSAGNEGTMKRHAQGHLTAGQTHAVHVVVPPNTPEVVLDIWYEGPDRISTSITPPAPATGSAVMAPPFSGNVPLSNGNVAFVDADLNDPGNADNRTFIVLRKGSRTEVEDGTWTIELTGTVISAGTWHAWIQRHSAAEFRPPFANAASTISIPGTSTGVITAGSYISGGGTVGTLSTFSSRGPTRDGRRAPTLSAPGQFLTAPQPGSTFGAKAGTSMAAPMIAGTAALMLEVEPTLTAAQVKTCLETTARLDAQTGPAAGNDWGAGKLDAQAACGCAASP